MSILKKLNKNKKEYDKYSHISKEDLNSLKQKCIDIKNDIELLSKCYSYENSLKIKQLSEEYSSIVKELKKYNKYTKMREVLERRQFMKFIVTGLLVIISAVCLCSLINDLLLYIEDRKKKKR